MVSCTPLGGQAKPGQGALMTHFIRAAALGHYVEVATRHGLNPQRMLRRAGIPPDVLNDPERPIAVERGYQLLEDSANASGVRSFGLEMGEANRLSTLGLLGLILREEPTLRQALQTLLHYRRLHNESLVLRLQEDAAHALLHLEYAAIHSAAPVLQATEQGLAMLVRALRSLMPPDWKPGLLCLMHARQGPAEVYQRVLGAPVRFNAEFNGALFPAKDLDRALHEVDPAMASVGRQQLDQLLQTRGAASTADRVRELAMVLLPLGRCSIEQVTAHLGMHRSTLHRQLLRDGTTFGAILDQVRRQLVRQLIASRQRSLIEITELLGFSSPPAFSRWYRRCFGETAQAQRRRLLAR